MEENYSINSVAAQSTYFKTKESKSKDTGIFLDTGAIEFIGKKNDVKFVIYKEDCIIALSNILLSLPLHISPAGKPSMISDKVALYEEYVGVLKRFFGEKGTAVYGPFDLSTTTSDRCYVYKLEHKSGFNIRNFLISDLSQITLKRNLDGTIDFRFSTQRFDCKQQCKAEGDSINLSDNLHPTILYGAPGIVSFDKKLLTAMRTKPFLLLAGISGTGKSRIVKQMAFRSCPNVDQLRSDKTSPGNYQLIEVKPNWHDSTEVIGYESAITNKYIVTPFVKFLVKAMCHPDVPFFVCMDEMNLAPVEQYFAEFLSVLESRKLVNGTITSEPLIKADVFQKYGFGNENIFDLLGLKRVPCSLSEIESVMLGGSSATSEYFEREDIVDKLRREGLRIPSNLIVVGTVNMDETTHQFSRKVIDRAMTIEMNIADSKEPFNNFFAGSNELDYLDTPSRKELFLPTVVQANEALDRLSEEDKKYLVEKIPTFLHSLNRALNGTPFKIAYRVQNELVLYFYELRREEKNVSAEELLARAMDAILMLKVLPRIEGDEELLGEPLKKLAEFTANYKQAHAKVEEMRSRLNAHFTSFWP